MIRGSMPPPSHRIAHRKKLVASYDRAADSTQLAVVTHKGKYFFTVQRPRLMWLVRYAGRVPGPLPPDTVVLEFRTQAPQVARDSRLVIASAGGPLVQVGSSGAFSDAGVLTWSHYMRFAVPTAALAQALAGDEASVSVGGITERLKPDEMNALRDLLQRVGAWPVVQAPEGSP